ncbi:MAG: FkbM family methyltransferase [Verrucomicrobiales bacterium]|nr:FkbM family methyltransferase [Verrucomicrobiales bacterium]
MTAPIQKRHRDQLFGGTTYAQHGEDLMLCNLFQLMGIDRPGYLDLGAYHPFVISNTALLYERGSRGVNVEANPRLVSEFQKARPEDLTVNLGVGPEQGTFPFYRFTEQGVLNTFSEPLAGTRSSGRPVHDVIHLPIWTISQIVDEYCGGVYPDLVSMDLEGLDLPVLKSADFSISRPRVVIAELQGENAAEARLLMADWGFRVLCRMVSNLLFVHEDWIGKVS